MGVRSAGIRRASSERVGGRHRSRVAALATAVVVAAALAVGQAAPAPAAAAKGPKPGGEITYGLEAETGGGWCPSNARLAISGIEVAAAIYDTLTVPEHQGRDRALPGQVGHAQRRLHLVDDHPA